MNELIGDVLAQHFITLPFVTRTAGCVEIFKKSTKSVIKKFPVAGQIYKTDSGQIYCDKSEDYQPITPNSQETGIVFFEEVTEFWVLVPLLLAQRWLLILAS